MKTIVFFFIAVFMIGCNPDITQKRIIDNTVIYGKVKIISQTLYCIKEKFGEMEKTGNPLLSFSSYDNNTNLIMDSISGEIESVRTNYKYDIENKIIEQVCFYYPKMQIDTIINQKPSIGLDSSIKKYEYSNSNKKRKEIYKYHNHNTISVSHFNDENELVEYNEYNKDGSLSKTYNYSYDSQGNLIEEIIGSLTSSTTINYSYDERSNLIQKKVNGLINVNYSYENFDSNGNWLKQNIEVINLKPNYGYNVFNVYGNWTAFNDNDNSKYVNERTIEYYK